MYNLLSAEFVRLRKNKAFWLGMAVLFVTSAFAVVSKYSDMAAHDIPAHFEDALFHYIYMVSGCISIFCGLFIGTEYSDGTIRNKLVVGHGRGRVYLAGLLVCIAATLFMALAFLLPCCVLGGNLLLPPELSVGQILYWVGISVLTMVACTAIFHALAMLIPKKSTSAVICIVAFVALSIAAAMIDARLQAPEYVSNYTLSINGVPLADQIPNPKYLRGTAREVYQFFSDFLPLGQAIQMLRLHVIHPVQMTLYSLIVILVSATGGIWVFRRKNLN